MISFTKIITMLNCFISRLTSVSLMVLFFSSSVMATQAPKPTDGPYIFNENGKIKVQYVLVGEPHELIIEKEDATVFEVEGLPTVDLTDLDRPYEYQSSYTGVEKIFALSDVHGQYDLMIDLLKGNQIIDADEKWTFSDGHVVVTGDNFGRGDKVMEILWFLYRLEKEAQEAGGKVHILLGNHESMVLNNDLRYLNRKYYYASGAFKTRYDQFFRKGSVLGDWLSKHNVLTSINQHLFVHGGISVDLLKKYKSIDEINQDFIRYLVSRDDVPEVTHLLIKLLL